MLAHGPELKTWNGLGCMAGQVPPLRWNQEKRCGRLRPTERSGGFFKSLVDPALDRLGAFARNLLSEC
jgi:hypothetical protein